MKIQKLPVAFFHLSLLFLTIQAFGQKDKHKISIPFDSLTQKYAYVNVFEVPNKSSAALYKSAKDWSKVKYADDKFLIDTENEQLNDLGNFTINVVMKGGMMKMPFVYTVIFNQNFYFKEGKTKLEITNIKLTQNAQGTTQEQTLEAFKKQQEGMGMGKNIMKGFIVDVFNEIDANMLKLIAEVEAGLKEESKRKSDW